MIYSVFLSASPKARLTLSGVRTGVLAPKQAAIDTPQYLFFVEDREGV
jgi:hypothetical protein